MWPTIAYAVGPVAANDESIIQRSCRVITLSATKSCVSTEPGQLDAGNETRTAPVPVSTVAFSSQSARTLAYAVGSSAEISDTSCRTHTVSPRVANVSPWGPGVSQEVPQP